MANLIISDTNAVDANGATVTAIEGGGVIGSASVVMGNLVASNTQNPVIGRRMRTELASPIIVRVDFGQNFNVQLLAIRFPRDTPVPTGSIRHLLDPDGGTFGAGSLLDTGGLPLDLGTYQRYGYHIYTASQAYSARYWEMELYPSDVDFVDIGRLWAGRIIQPSINPEYGWRDSWVPLGNVTTAPRSGAEYPDPAGIRRKFEFEFGFLSEADKNDLRDLQASASIHNQVLCVVDPDASDVGRLANLGRLTELSPIRQPLPANYRARFSILESM